MRLSEFTRSETAARMGRPIFVAPDSPELHNLERLCRTVLQPLREAFGVVPGRGLLGGFGAWMARARAGAS